MRNIATIASSSLVREFKEGIFIQLLREKTGWPDLGEIQNKPQIKYLISYLSEPHIDAKTMIIEDEYLDRYFSSDFSEYYSKAFAAHSKIGTRIHFFRKKFESKYFLTYLNSANAKDVFDSESYIGHIILRPIPKAFLARTCIRPYIGLTKNFDEYKIITRNLKLNPFGHEVNLKCTPLMEQDEAVSACATSALWSLLSMSPWHDCNNAPSLNEITKAAGNNEVDGTRIFPTSGLTATQISRCLSNFNLEPQAFKIKIEGDRNLFKEICYAYLNADIPVLISGDIYNQVIDQDGVLKIINLGGHSVCGLGFHLDQTTYPDLIKKNSIDSPNKPKRDELPPFLRAHAIDKLYVNDDQFGPLLRLQFDNKIDLTSNESSPQTSMINNDGQNCYLKCNINELKLKKEIIARYFVPEHIHVGLYHKIRITYHDTKYLLTSMLSLIGEYGYKSQCNSEFIADFIVSEWSISMVLASNLKAEILNGSDFHSFNGLQKKHYLLAKNLPKYIWSITGYRYYSGVKIKCSQFLLDATEIPYGNIFLGYITYSQDDASLLDWMVDFLKSTSLSSLIKLKDTHKNKLIPISTFASKKAISSAYYLQYLLRPNRTLKNGEANDFLLNIIERNDLISLSLLFADKLNLETLERHKKYIWLIDENYRFVYGEDIEINEKFQGHPTLSNYGLCFAAGELIFLSEAEKWELNLHSGTYRYSRDIARRTGCLNQVKSLFFSELTQLTLDPKTNM